jgi:hypothetical protein
MRKVPSNVCVVSYCRLFQIHFSQIHIRQQHSQPYWCSFCWINLTKWEVSIWYFPHNRVHSAHNTWYQGGTFRKLTIMHLVFQQMLRILTCISSYSNLCSVPCLYSRLKMNKCWRYVTVYFVQGMYSLDGDEWLHKELVTAAWMNCSYINIRNRIRPNHSPHVAVARHSLLKCGCNKCIKLVKQAQKIHHNLEKNLHEFFYCARMIHSTSLIVKYNML